MTCLFKAMFSSSFSPFWLLIFGLGRLSVFLRDSRSVLWHVWLAWLCCCLPTFSVVTFVVMWFGNGCSLVSFGLLASWVSLVSLGFLSVVVKSGGFEGVFGRLRGLCVEFFFWW